MGKKKPAREEETRPWERQKGESEAAWEAFLTFRDMEKRGTEKVAEQLSKSRQLISRWKAKWTWEERCRAYDNELQKEAFRDAVKERRKMNERHINLSMRLQKAAFDALKNKDFSKMADKDISSFVRIATDLERLARADDIAMYQEETRTEQISKKMENNIFDVISQSTGEELSTADIPEIEQTAESSNDVVE